MKIDSEEIKKALKLFFCKEDVFEIRCLEATSFSNGSKYISRPHIESGYFDYDNIPNVAQALSHIQSARGIYVTPNPVTPELLARCANRIQVASSDNTTKDKHILKRRWLLIDCDVEHNGVSGISSTDEEHNEALAKADEIKNNLSQAGWPEPIVMDSGNGASLMYMVDLDTSETSNVMIASINEALQDFNSACVKVDPQVKNLSRIWRLPGTMNCKGDNIAARPHRMARIISYPEAGTECVELEMLEKVADYGYSKNHKAQSIVPQYIPTERFDLDNWIRSYCPDVDGPVQSGDQRKWFFKECPFSSGHSSPQGKKDTYIGQYSNGAFFFKCSHSHCADKDFHSLRDLLEPDWRTSTIYPDVNISKISSPFLPVAAESCDLFEDVPEEELKETSDYIPFPKELYDVHGFIKEIMDTTMKYAPSPNRPLALAGALSLMSFLCARKVKTESGLRPNIYILALAKSGSGKEKPRDVNQLVLETIGLDNCILENIASGEGLEDMLIAHNALIWQCDEFYSIIKAMTSKINDSKASIMKYLLVLYTSAHKNFTTRAKVGKDGVTIPKPHLTLFATTTPNGFFESINEQVLNDGMFARMNIIIADDPQKAKMMPEVELSENIIKTAKMWRDFIPPENGNIDYNAMLVPYTASAREIAQKLFDEQFDICKKMNDNKQDEWKIAAWNRFFELTMRYALLYACSETSSPDKTVITPEAISWASSFVRWEIKNKIHITERKFYKSDFDKESEGVIEFMKRWHSSKGDTPMPAWKFNRLAKWLKDKKAIVENLISQKRLVHEITPAAGHGRPKDIYWLPEFQKKEKKEREDKDKEI